ncbi:TIGR03067 domain-containing protein [Gimesia panareensis]|uniref:Uncharacterized protein n=1 Tax=Gimesia panareensis TaxID=2527978 RepID=A0A518A917_9PLAN|nr:TIGR03067 domain-containing protein [Gimesia panareensis]QDT28358.1 hypothetical protein Enr10x_37000 [Gimesia panareensis]QDU51226.1 hypothetical protein Pan110_35900 [Gimesia panareensis]
MQRSFSGLKYLVTFTMMTTLTATASADDARAKAIQKDRNQIAGTWKIVALTVNGNKSKDEDAQKLTVVNGADGTWSLRSEGNEIVRGTTSIDPTLKPKTIDIQPTTGGDKGKTYLGIYDLGESTRKLCFAPAGIERPTVFKSSPGDGRILVKFERVEKNTESTSP